MMKNIPPKTKKQNTKETTGAKGKPALEMKSTAYSAPNPHARPSPVSCSPECWRETRMHTHTHTHTHTPRLLAAQALLEDRRHTAEPSAKHEAQSTKQHKRGFDAEINKGR